MGVTLGDALGTRGLECAGVGARGGAGPAGEVASSFEGTARQLADVAAESGPVDVVVVALGTEGPATGTSSPGPGGWQQVLDEHEGVSDRIRVDAAWARAVADHAAATDRPVRVVTVVEAASAGDWSRA